MTRVLWTALLLVLLTVSAQAAVPIPLPGENAPSVVLWTAQDSDAGGALADARLDQPVRFWRAGLSVAEVFAGVKEQTGVEVGFWPAEMADRPARVNLYLNPKKPPTLRSLMAQLSWVLDCSFGCAEGEPRGYFLLGTGLGQGVAEKVQSELITEAQSRREEMEGRPERVRTRLEEYRTGLTLSQDEAIARYRGVDDRFLLDLLDPRRRAVAEFVLSLSAGQMDALLEEESGKQEIPYAALSADQRAWAAKIAKRDRLPETVVVQVRALGDMLLSIRVDRGADGEGRSLGFGSLEISRIRPLHITGQIALRRQLGESVSPEEETRLIEEDRAQRERERTDASAKERTRLLSEPALTDSGRDRLMSASLQWTPGQDYALWQVQEAAAVLTGRHIVSDCLYQPPQSEMRFEDLDVAYQTEEKQRELRLREWARAHPGKDPEGDLSTEEKRELETLQGPSSRSFPVLYWLISLCRGAVPGEDQSLPPVAAQISSPEGLEWGEAGQFLHFRSQPRALLRAMVLPESTLARFRALESPPLEKVDFATDKTPRIGYRLDLAGAAGTLEGVNLVQIVLGSQLIYEDPATRLGSARAMTRARIGEELSEAGPFVQLLSTLSRRQWQKLAQSGLNCQRDLTPTQKQSLLLEVVLKIEPSKPGKKLTLSDLVLVAGQPSWDEEPELGASYFLRIGGADSQYSATLKGDTFDAPQPLPHLVPVPQS